MLPNNDISTSNQSINGEATSNYCKLPDEAATDRVSGSFTVLAARELLARFAATLFLDPMAGAWEKLHVTRTEHELFREAASLFRQAALDANDSVIAADLDALDPSPVLARLPASRRDLLEEYDRTFGIVAAGAYPLYATEYLPARFTFQRSQMMADIAGFYQAFKLQIAASRPERPDHLVCQLQFVAWLIYLERNTWSLADESGQGRRAVCRQAQQRFVRDYVAFWLPSLARCLASEAPDGFYGTAARFLGSWLAAECAWLDIEPVAAALQPSLIEPPECCSACLTDPGEVDLHDIRPSGA
ncbi:MAG: hypothetical protein KatS3mg110_3048 [Pirellulaceae bacterium]|nr:MAG: hypothetical protein KatS3mg110_3048 [Pirellulaceae bacterium]